MSSDTRLTRAIGMPGGISMECCPLSPLLCHIMRTSVLKLPSACFSIGEMLGTIVNGSSISSDSSCSGEISTCSGASYALPSFPPGMCRCAETILSPPVPLVSARLARAQVSCSHFFLCKIGICTLSASPVACSFLASVLISFHVTFGLPFSKLVSHS